MKQFYEKAFKAMYMFMTSRWPLLDCSGDYQQLNVPYSDLVIRHLLSMWAKDHR